MKLTPFAFLAGLVALVLAGCAEPRQSKPAFYANLTRGGSLNAEDATSTINLFRSNNELPALTLDPRLTAVAEAYASDLATRAQKGNAIQPDGKLKERLATAGIAEVNVRENVSAGYQTFAEAFSGWRQSKRHKETMLAPKGTRMGIAAVYRPGTKYRVYWVLIVTGPAE